MGLLTGRLGLLLAPVAFAFVLAVIVGGLFIAGWIGRPATGERTVVTVRSDCPDDWSRVIGTRANSIGLGDRELSVDGDTTTLISTFPGLPDDIEAIPALLTKTGAFAVYAVESAESEPSGEPVVTHEDIIEVHLDLDLRNHPLVQLSFQPNALTRLRSTEGALLSTIDGEVVSTSRAPLNGKLIELQPFKPSLKEELRVATDWNIVLRSGPAPCSVKALEVTVVAAPVAAQGS